MADKEFERRSYPVDRPDHMIRPRINALLGKAMHNQLVVVCAGAGYGKTSAVFDFVQEREASTGWIQISERDNIGSRFWENFTHTITLLDEDTAKGLLELGFPDTADKLNQYINFRNRSIPNREFILVFDDVHLLTDPAVKRFLEQSIYHMPGNVSMFLLCREFPQINLTSMQIKGQISIITEEDLNFTQTELAQYLDQQGLTAIKPPSLNKIYHDTKGWAFAVNLVALSLKNAPGYEGYVQQAMKQNIFGLMESEVWDVISERLQHFLVRLSLIGHLAADLVADLAGGDTGLLAELRQQNAYIRFDSYINAYVFHHLFLDFLRTKQDILSGEERQDTYGKAADWCVRNDFKIDAMGYYEHVGDYASIISIFSQLPTQIPQDIAHYALAIFERAPEGMFYQVAFFAARHIRTLLSLGRWDEATKTAKHYEQSFLQFSGNEILKNHALGGIYYAWGKLRMPMGITEDRYDFDRYFAKMDECLSKFPVDTDKIPGFLIGPWISMVGSARKGAQQEFGDALTRAVAHISHCLDDRVAGLDDLCKGELKFYQGDVSGAELLVDRALEKARTSGKYEIMHRALFYSMRIAFLHGDHTKAAQALHEMEGGLSEEENASRFITYDIALGWYYCFLREADMVPGWIKDRFAPYGNAIFIENFGNQVKARYCYLTKNHPPLLTYIEELKLRESILFGRIEMLAIEACVYFQRKEKSLAFAALKEAYDAALPNDIIMPFIELGRDMRTLTASAQRDPDCGLPRPWLEAINRKAATYAKHQSLLISDYKKNNGGDSMITLSSREKKVLQDLYHGLSRSEIAANQNLSINTINSIVNNIYEKLNANNIVDVVRIVVERNLL